MSFSDRAAVAARLPFKNVWIGPTQQLDRVFFKSFVKEFHFFGWNAGGARKNFLGGHHWGRRGKRGKILEEALQDLLERPEGAWSSGNVT